MEQGRGVCREQELRQGRGGGRRGGRGNPRGRGRLGSYSSRQPGQGRAANCTVTSLILIYTSAPSSILRTPLFPQYLSATVLPRPVGLAPPPTLPSPRLGGSRGEQGGEVRLGGAVEGRGGSEGGCTPEGALTCRSGTASDDSLTGPSSWSW